ncbi:ParB/RepB/Spo0J family partition protein [Pararobbsia silviterrae]|uniref:Transcriptional regulator n=1 Tax=Pararobbsia silviterrae TaxID=1792498 RepID=A0A494XEZ0_9BURK|nr:ParB N-terminal domain-containing protein [Pararobbsia silviterrae]RKP46664.1 transcriptional regulator [Pararobbsia silviterrae]
MSKRATTPLVLDAVIVTGNAKAAIKAARGGSSDLWAVPPDEIHYDARDNIRPLDKDRVRHVANLIKANGFDRKSPLGCIVKKIGGEDLIFVYAGQHRYHAVLLAIKEGAEIDRVPIVIDDAKTVNRANMIVAGVVDNDSEKLSPLDLALAIVELRALDVDDSTIRERLNITDQTVRDVLLLADAPKEIHKLVRDKTIAGTLAIEEIRKHGPEKACDRLVAAASKAKAEGKAKVTKKALPKPASATITPLRAKQLLQALQSVLHDPIFGKLSPGTIEGVHEALTGLEDLLELPVRKKKHAIHVANEHGVYDHETINAPLSKRTRKSPLSIHLAHVAQDQWIFALTYQIGTSFYSSPCKLSQGDTTYPTRGEAIRVAVRQATVRIRRSEFENAKELPSVRAWLDKLWLAPDPDWTEDLAEAS